MRSELEHFAEMALGRPKYSDLKDVTVQFCCEKSFYGLRRYCIRVYLLFFVVNIIYF